ncbi:hypothetical protein Tco_1250315 [Tanacetum coccineum]
MLYLDDYATREEVILSDEERLNVIEIIDQDPIRYDEAIKHEKWVKAMDQEIQSIEKNETWQLVDLPEDVKCIEDGYNPVIGRYCYSKKLAYLSNGCKIRLPTWNITRERIETYFLKEGNDKELLEDFKESIKAEFEMSDMGKMSCNVMVNPIIPECKLRRKEGESVDETLFKQLVGSLMYIITTRPDIQFVLSLISRFMSKLTGVHLAAATRIMRYIQGTLDYRIWYKKGGEGNMKVFTDSDYAGGFDDMKKAEYVPAAACACQVIWVCGVLEELNLKMEEKTVINYDNTSAIKLSRNPVFHGRCKHIGVRFHFLRDLVSDGVIELEHCGTKEQVADIFTKPLYCEVFMKLSAEGVFTQGQTRHNPV